jgi:Family of unknown function (DUF6152)
MRLSSELLALTLLATSVNVDAHHVFSTQFDINRPVLLTGTVTELHWVNPHTWIHLDVGSADGRVQPWKIEGASPNTLIRRGFTKDSLLPGMLLRISGFQARDGSSMINGRDLTFPDGHQLFVGYSGTGAADDAPAR